MEILIGGISKEFLKRTIRPFFEELGYSKIKFYQANKIKHSKEIIENSELDLMILSGWKDGNYHDFYKLSFDNPQIPSILVIANSHQGVMNEYVNIHPPSYTCYFGELEHLNNKRIDYILNGGNLNWGI